MNILIIVLNVEDGDAIIVRLSKESKHFVILIDGGRAKFAKMIIDELKVILADTNKNGPDLILCTHYDTDHIGGLPEIVRFFKNDIGQIWIHNTTGVLEIPSKLRSKSDKSIFPTEADLNIGADEYNRYVKDLYAGLVLETIQEEVDLIELIDHLKIPRQEPIAGKCLISGWQEIEIIGPSMAYYKELFPAHFDIKQFLEASALELKSESEDNEKYTSDDPCVALENTKRSKITNINLNSSIMKITIDEKVFIFSADAGINSFCNVPDYETILKDIFWLKVPHHGSKNNINSALINLMSPKYAAISGNNHIDELVKQCLQSKKTEVRTTKESGHLSYSF